MPPAPVPQLHDSVLDALGEEIAGGALQPGTTLSTDDVVARFEVSRSVVREAVRVLESLGMLRVRRRVGITVQPESCWSVLDPNVIRWRVAGPGRLAQLTALAELRSGTEPLAARLAAERADAEQCGRLARAVAGMARHADDADGDDYLAHDIDFHTTLLAASGNPMLRTFAPIVAEVLAGRTRHDLMPRRADPTAIRLHGEVAQAVSLGDRDAAEQAMRRIIDESNRAVRERSGQERGRPMVE